MKREQVKGQIDMNTYLKENRTIFPACDNCVCSKCLLGQSGRCPYGGCYDDLRARVNPYDKAHPGQPPRQLWSNWNKPGEQAHWCRGGAFYPVRHCEKFIKYTGCQVKDCIKAVVAVYQDGYISCSLVDSIGCEVCYKEFEEKQL